MMIAKVGVMPKACKACGGDLLIGKYRHPACRPCVQCGRHDACCPARTGSEADADARDADLAVVAQLALERIGNGAAVAQPALLAELLGVGVGDGPLATSNGAGQRKRRGGAPGQGQGQGVLAL